MTADSYMNCFIFSVNLDAVRQVCSGEQLRRWMRLIFYTNVSAHMADNRSSLLR